MTAARFPDWSCTRCGQTVEADFDFCWNCGTSRSGDVDSNFVPAVVDQSECPSCGYLLFGLPTAQCPECGNPFDPGVRDTPADPLPPEQKSCQRHGLNCVIAIPIVVIAAGLFVYFLMEYLDRMR
jgi:ribosomal protein L37E